jgi:hypothetical protein
MGKVAFVDGYKKIIIHFVFAVKHDLCHQACLVQVDISLNQQRKDPTQA